MALSELNWKYMASAIESLTVAISELDRVAIVFDNLQALAVRSRNPLEYEALDWPALAEITCRGPLATFDEILRSYRSTLIHVPGAAARLEGCRRKLFATTYSLWFASDVDAEELETPIAEALRETKGLLEQLAMYADAMDKPLIAAQARNSNAMEPKEQKNALGCAAQSEVPSIREVMADPACSFWLRNALDTALSRDPADAANDAELLARVLAREFRKALRGQ